MRYFLTAIGATVSTSDNYCTWTGVTCEDGGVYSVDLSNKGISGVLPPTFDYDCLAHMIWLDISSTGVSGSFDSSFGLLPVLDYLNIGHTAITGEIPSSFSKLTSLKFLYMNNVNVRVDLSLFKDSDLDIYSFVNSCAYGPCYQ